MGLQVQADSLFVGVEMEEEPAFLGMRVIFKERPYSPCSVPLARLFHLDDLGTVVS
jgi:hypothetical protein